MDYIISEDRFVSLIDKYITLAVGELIKTKSSHQHGEKEDFDLIDKNDNIIFQYLRGGHLGVSRNLFLTISELFGRNIPETEGLIQRWFEKKYPNKPVKDVYYSMWF